MKIGQGRVFNLFSRVCKILNYLVGNRLWTKLVNSSFWFHIYYRHRKDFKKTCKSIKEEHRSFRRKVLEKRG